MYPNERDAPLATRSQQEKSRMSRQDRHISREPHYTGGTVEVERYSDGSSTVNWGGPCAPTNYDANGEEC